MMLDTPHLDIGTLNDLPAEAFARALDGVFEHAPWVAEAAAAGRPYADAAALHAGLMAALRAAPEAARIALLNGHADLAAGAPAPDLPAPNLPAPDPTDASRAEQASVPLSAVIDAAPLTAMLRDYRARHGIPFIVALRRRTPESVLRALAERTARETPQEIEAALEEVGHVSRLRLFDRLSDAPGPKGSLRLVVGLRDPAAPVPRIALVQESRPLWTGEGVMGKAVTLLGEAELRIGLYAVALEGWPDDALPRGAALRFAVRDPEERLLIRLTLLDRGVTMSVSA